MPTVLTEGGFAIRIYLPPREHEPPHVHVVKGGGEAVIALGNDETPPVLDRVYGMRARDVLRAYRIVEANRTRLLEAWRRYHG